MRHVLSELRYVLRQLRQSPVFTAAAVLTLALGIGGTTAIFTLIHAVMLRSLPVARSRRAVPHRRRQRLLRRGRAAGSLGDVLVPALRAAESRSAGVRGADRLPGRRRPHERPARAASSDAARPLRAEYVTGNYFSTLGVGAFGGPRLHRRDDDTPAAAPVGVLSHHAWQDALRRRSVGRRRRRSSSRAIRSRSSAIAPPGFFGETLRGDPPDLWLPLQQEPLIDGDGALLRQPVSAWLRVIGRLRPAPPSTASRPRLTGAAAQLDAARLRLSRQLDARRRSGCCRSR